MAFESLSDKLQNVFKKLRSKGSLTEDDVKAALNDTQKVIDKAIKDIDEMVAAKDKEVMAV